jgi:hypothetical protein
MGLHCLFRDEDANSDLPISAPSHSQLQHFHFTFSQWVIGKMFSDARRHLRRNTFLSGVDLADGLRQVISAAYSSTRRSARPPRMPAGFRCRLQKS